MTFSDTTPPPLICIGHRGAMGHAPENTLLSVQTALNLGAHWIEIDVHLADGRLVVIHDAYLERTTNGQGAVAAQSFAYLRSLNAGAGQQIPTLAEVFDLVDRRAGINIELKGANTAAPVVRLVADYISQGWSYDQILISSFDHQMLERVKRLNPKIKIGALIIAPPAELAEFGEKLGAYSIHPWVGWVTREFVQDAHKRGLKVFVYTVNDPDDIARMYHIKVDGLFTDYPERVL